MKTTIDRPLELAEHDVALCSAALVLSPPDA